MLKNSPDQGNTYLPSEFAILVHGLGLSQEEACQLFSVRKKTLRQWLYSYREVPPPVMEELRTLSLKHVKRVHETIRNLSNTDPIFYCSQTDVEAVHYGWLSLSNERHALSSVFSLCLLNNISLPRVEYYAAS